MYCGYCGNEVPEGMSYCVFCGRESLKEYPPSTRADEEDFDEYGIYATFESSGSPDDAGPDEDDTTDEEILKKRKPKKKKMKM